MVPVVAWESKGSHGATGTIVFMNIRLLLDLHEVLYEKDNDKSYLLFAL